MIPIKLSEIFSIFDKKMTIEDVDVKNISTDSRTIGTDDLFVPIVGENFDGHKFIEKALMSGASASLCNIDQVEKYSQFSEKIIPVENTLDALLKIAGHYRKQFNFPITAITGSNGKTTVKDILVHLLSAKYKTNGTFENFNNEIGVPKTVFSCDSNTEFLVVEMGMRGKGQIRKLVSEVKPTSAVISMIGEAHFELLGSRKNIAEAKAEITEQLPKSGFVVMNGDDDFADLIEEKSSAPVYFFGKSDRCMLKILSCSQKEDGIDVEAKYKDKKINYFVPLLGIHNVYNASGALLSALLSGVELEKAIEQLKTVKISGSRIEIIKTDKYTILNDCYNSSPSSAKAGVAILSSQHANHRTAIIGDMGELGDISESSHYELGQKIGEAKIDLLLVAGKFANLVIEGALSAGMDKNSCISFEKTENFEKVMDKIPLKSTVLVKASHAMHFENITKCLSK